MAVVMIATVAALTAGPAMAWKPMRRRGVRWLRQRSRPWHPACSHRATGAVRTAIPNT